MNYTHMVVLSLLVFLSTGCLVSDKSTNLLSEIGKSTCQSAKAYSYDGVVVKFQIPEEALDFKITRDGNSIHTTKDHSEVQKIDGNLTPGQTYHYRCEIIIDQNRGFEQVGEELVVTMPIATPPKFSGLKKISLSNSSAALLEWDLTEDSLLSHYKVFKYIGTATDKTQFPSEPVATLTDLFAVSELVSNLGDEITYSFRVSACNSADICDDNNQILSLLTPDTGAPKTNGATSATLVNGTVVLIAPWSDANGHVASRGIYRTSTNVGSACPTVFGMYSKVNDIIVTEPRETPVTFNASGVLNEGQKYCFVVRDTDPSNNTETNTNVKFVEIGDLTNPDFTSPVSLVRSGSDPEGTVTASWTAMAREQDEPLLGAYEYLLYISSVAHGATPDVNPCDTGSLYQTIPAVGYSQGSIVSVEISGLNARSWHRVCVKAKDSASNESTQEPKALASTGDATAPSFAGIQSAVFNNATSSVDVSFIVPQDLDIKNYKITTVRTRQGVQNSPIIITKNMGVLTPSSTAVASFSLAEASLIDNDSVAVKIDACDDAAPDYNALDNCSVTLAEVVVGIPDATPPQGFTGIATGVRGATHRSIEVSWGTPTTGNWNDYVGFKIYYVNDIGILTGLNSADCLCTGSDCNTNPKTSCEVNIEDGGSLLIPSKTYEMYVAAYDAAGNQTKSYIAHTGSSKITALSQAQDIVLPSFNASMVISYENGAKIVFNGATDDQDPVLDIEYEIYRLTDATFTCPNTPYDAGGGCDGLSPIATVLESVLSEESGKKVYLDATVTDGHHYYYQLCALDNAQNRRCQAGGVGDINITDVTAPVIANVDTSKKIGNGTSWTVSFEVSDNIVSVGNLSLEVYKSITAYPDSANPGVATFTKAGGTITLSGNVASFNDSGLADVESAYYLIKAQDLSGNKSYEQTRDMGPAPVITNIIWPAPLKVNGQPITATSLASVANSHVIIQGQNLSSILEINENTSAADAHDKRHCTTAEITEQTDTQITCHMLSGIYYTINYNLYIVDKYNRQIHYSSGSPSNYCDYAAANGITDLKGLGTLQDQYALCTPDHFKLIGRNADNPNNTEDIIGYFAMPGDVDFAGVTDFTGIPVMQAGEFFLEGNDKFIKNLTIDTSSTGTGTNNDAAFVLGCEGSYLGIDSFFRNVQFDNAIVRTGTGRAAVGILEKNCTWQVGVNFLNSSGIKNSEIHANNTAGFWAAEYTATQDDFYHGPVTQSKIYSTRPDDTTAVGGFFGKLKGSATFASPLMKLTVEGIEFRPEVGQTDSGYNIGGLIGEIDAPNILIDTWYAKDVEIHGGLDNIGGAIGRFNVDADNVTIQAGHVYDLLIENASNPGSTANYRGGIVGKLKYASGVGAVSGLRFDSVYVRESDIYGTDYLGGVIGRAERSPDLTIENGSYLRAVNIYGKDNIGGFVGAMDRVSGFVMDDFHVGTNNPVTLNGENNVGGFVGNSYQVTGSYTNLSVQRLTINANTGTAVGGMFGLVDQTTFTGSQLGVGLTTIYGDSRVGGMFGQVGRSSLNLSNSYTHTDTLVYGSSYVGGAFGYFTGTQRPLTIVLENNAVHGKVISSGSSYLGAFWGHYFIDLVLSTITMDNNYYRNDWTDTNIVNTNVAYEAVGEVEGKTQAELNIQATYVNWDFTSTWYMTTDHAKLSIFSGYGGL